MFNDDIMQNQELVDEQREIEEQIAEQQRRSMYNLEMREAAEVAEAANEVDNSQDAYA